MRIKRIALSSAVAAAALTASLLLITVLASAQPASTPPPLPADDLEHIVKSPSVQPISVTFPAGPWPWFAQEEISMHPEPPRAGHPTEICAEVINHDPANVHTATLEFGIANFGIGVPFMHVGAVDVHVPPDGHARGCVVWVPPESGPQCIEVLLWQPGAPEPQRSLRHIIVRERPMFAGQELEMVFQVGPFDIEGDVTFSLTNMLPGWDVWLTPPTSLWV